MNKFAAQNEEAISTLVSKLEAEGLSTRRNSEVDVLHVYFGDVNLCTFYVKLFSTSRAFYTSPEIPCEAEFRACPAYFGDYTPSQATFKNTKKGYNWELILKKVRECKKAYEISESRKSNRKALEEKLGAYSGMLDYGSSRVTIRFTADQFLALLPALIEAGVVTKRD